MADSTDVETILVSMASAALYPNGTGQASSAGVAVQCFRGWPTPQAQQNALANNFVNLSVVARDGVEHNTTRYPLVWQTVTPPAHTLTVIVNGNVVTIGGTVEVPQNVIVLIGGTLYKKQFVYAVQQNDTLTSIAAAIATLINVAFPGTTSSGPAVTIASPMPVIARVASQGTIAQEVGRQKKSFQISVWAPPCNVKSSDADLWRTQVAKIVDLALRPVIRIVMPDQFFAHLIYDRTITIDKAQADGLYRRDLFYWVEYATTITQNAYEIGVMQNTLQAGVSPTGDLPLPSGAPTITTNN